jgi:hypothetical protein
MFKYSKLVEEVEVANFRRLQSAVSENCSQDCFQLPLILISGQKIGW